MAHKRHKKRTSEKSEPKTPMNVDSLDAMNELLSFLLLSMAGPAAADSKDESGKGKKKAKSPRPRKKKVTKGKPAKKKKEDKKPEKDKKPKKERKPRKKKDDDELEGEEGGDGQKPEKEKKKGLMDSIMGIFGKKEKGDKKGRRRREGDEKISTKKERGDYLALERESKVKNVDYASARFEELETYPINEPFAYVRILYDKKEFRKIYHAVEPELTRRERHAYDLIYEALKKAFNVPIDDIDNEVEKYLKRATREANVAYDLQLNKRSLDKVFYYLERDLVGYGNMDVLMRDPNIEDISCDGPLIPIFIYDRRYESMETSLFWDDEMELNDYVIRLAQRCDKHLSIAEPLLDATLMDGSRAIISLGREVTTRGSSFCIRKFREEPFTPTDLIDFNTISSIIVAYLWIAIHHGMSMLICGGTASGKTTTLNAIALFMHQDMKIVSIEETRELNLPHPNWLPGLTREGFGGESDLGAVTMYALLRAALRERPEYIVVGEIRGKEAYVLFQAMATGHTTYSTVHADSVQALVHRLENKPIDIPRVMIPALDACVIQMQTRIGERRVRRAKQVVEIIGLDPHTEELLTNEVFRWIPATDEFEFSGKSYILEKVMVKTNLSKPEIMEELTNRKRVLDWLVSNDIRDHKDFGRVIMEYYLRPEEVMKQITAMEMEQMATRRGPTDIKTDNLMKKGTEDIVENTGGFMAVEKKPCPSCGEPVRVDRDSCPKCGKELEVLQ